MVEVIITEFQGIIEEVEVFSSPLDADIRWTTLVLKSYQSIDEYQKALDDSNAETVIHHYSGIKVK